VRARRVKLAALLAVAGTLSAAVVFGVWYWFGPGGGPANRGAAVSNLRLEDIPFNGQRAYGYLKQLCQIGRRPSGSPGMVAQQKLLAEHFQRCGAQVRFQRFRAPDPRNGAPVPMANLIVHWHPQSKQRILLCAHYDTLPYPMLDPEDRQGVFVGANDNASGVAILMELGHVISKLKCNYGIDFVFLDAEEYVFQDTDRFFLGSEYFARQYVADPPAYRYRYGVLLDMVGDRNLQIYQEGHSVWWRDTRPLVGQIWGVARRLGVREFIPQRKHSIRDDHLCLHDICGIACIDVIDYEYPPWHTRADTPERVACTVWHAQ